ncbi:hypothetical protein BN77_3537 [Rhizobium mesoamericanum STM3625]|uniref:Uncharacterized protein n=1 Tax=Rhizobium mesoamericanum STM3625 TaxID=1211777 RepID=K0Q228_9HYPH|nr:hypothetical protein BN77_3537 [Rhizobium mesoamericanum STM3625]
MSRTLAWLRADRSSNVDYALISPSASRSRLLKRGMLNTFTLPPLIDNTAEQPSSPGIQLRSSVALILSRPSNVNETFSW